MAGNVKNSDTVDWKDDRCLRLRVVGYKSSLMSVRELWHVTFSKTVIVLSSMFGAVAALAMTIGLRAVGDTTYLLQLLFIFVPVTVNFLACSVGSALVYLVRSRRRSAGAPVGTITISLTLIMFLIALIPISAINGLKVLGGGLEPEWLSFVLLTSPLVYVLVSDFLIYVIYEHISPSIWGRGHIYPNMDRPTQHRAETPSEPPPDATPEVAPIEAIQVKIGAHRVVQRDVLFLEAQGNYLRVVTQSDEFLDRFRISEAAALIGETSGVFLHRSRWVAFAGIEYVEHVGGQYRVKMLNEEVLTIASTRQQDVLEAFAENRVSIVRPPKRAQNG